MHSGREFESTLHQICLLLKTVSCLHLSDFTSKLAGLTYYELDVKRMKLFDCVCLFVCVVVCVCVYVYMCVCVFRGIETTTICLSIIIINNNLIN